VNVTDILEKNLTGLVANILSKKYKRPVLLLRYNEKLGIFNGSGRGYEKGAIKDLQKFLQATGQFNFVEGHANANGISINADKIVEANEYINEQLKEVEIDISVYEVDFILPVKSLTERFINEINRHRDLWGQQVEEPKIAIKDVEVNTDEIFLNGKTSKTIKFINKGIEFIKFFSSEEEYEELTSKGDRVILDVVGKCAVNSWEGKETPQIIMDEYEVTKIKRKELVF
jgi:single-stranded-DNA-specific exonuclease